MNKKTLSVLILISSVMISGVIVGSAMAQTPADQSTTTLSASITYPIPELGNCQSQADCKTFCDDTKNTDACLAFAQANNLMSSDQVAAAKKFADSGMVGPGGCKGETECDTYCGDTSHIEECITFAQNNGLMSEQKLQESQKVLAAIKTGVKPLGCNSEQECEAYCATAEHMEECINFGTEAGILPAQDQENARKVLTAIKNGAVPPCEGDACPAFCSKPQNADACEKFRIEAGIPSRSEMIVVQAILTLIAKGTTMSTCSGAQGCQDYCSQDAHAEECAKFAEDNGAITSSEAEAAIGGEAAPEGPGGCKTKDECDAYCNNPDNSETCFNYAKDNGLISSEDLKKIEDSQQQMKDSFNNMPAEILTCLTTSLGADTVEKLKSGNAIPDQKTAEQMKTCFDQYTPTAPTAPAGPGSQAGQNQGGQGQGGGGGGNGGGSGGGSGGGGQGQGNQPTQPTQPSQPMQPTQPTQPGQPTQPSQPSQLLPQTGPGGCKTIEECKTYCQAHPEAKTECQQFKQSQQGQSGQNQPTQGPNNQQPSQPSQPTPPQPPTQPTPPSQPSPP